MVVHLQKTIFVLGIAIGAIVITLTLFYIDEGAYSLSGFFDDSGNLFAFGLYTSVLFGLQLLLGKLLLYRYVGFKKVLYAFLATVALLLALLLAMLIGSLGRSL